MSVLTDIALLAQNDSVYTNPPIDAADVKALNINIIDSKEHKIPMVTTNQRNLITPSDRYLVYNTETKSYQYWDTAKWRDMGSAGNTSGTPALYIHKIITEDSLDTYTIPEVVAQNIDCVSRQGNFTENYDSTTDETDNFTIGGGAVTSGEIIRIFYHAGGALNINGLNVIANTSSARDADQAKNYSAGFQAISTKEIDFTATPTVNISLPSGMKMMVSMVQVVLHKANTVTGQPTIQLGTISHANQFEEYTTIGTSVGLFKQSVMGGGTGATDMQAKVTVAATATEMKGRAVFIGTIIQDEV